MTNKEARCLTEGVRVYTINSEHQTHPGVLGVFGSFFSIHQS